MQQKFISINYNISLPLLYRASQVEDFSHTIYIPNPAQFSFFPTTCQRPCTTFDIPNSPEVPEFIIIQREENTHVCLCCNLLFDLCSFQNLYSLFVGVCCWIRSSKFFPSLSDFCGPSYFWTVLLYKKGSFSSKVYYNYCNFKLSFLQLLLKSIFLSNPETFPGLNYPPIDPFISILPSHPLQTNKFLSNPERNSGLMKVRKGLTPRSKPGKTSWLI